MKKELVIRFPDQSYSFVHGAEYGRIWAKMERGDSHVDNCGFPVHLENVDLLRASCKQDGYIPFFGKEYFNTYVEFIGIKNTINLN